MGTLIQAPTAPPTGTVIFLHVRKPAGLQYAHPERVFRDLGNPM
jgi:hypothetical protein